ncbi:rho GTPase-activating protein gacO-like isoform X1 [Homalodisca vitripennis]|uniref:rho GTPase-activating protein gacO-like isoform X1 n=1 Tax=Homalodisca vitripennis TaxID=197043 RepID=UPI001EEC0856|nr:rho GTPase-activating protein gacO-like isoform X1 [Homalodisca vitripennis]
MATYRRNKSGGSQSEGASNSASPASSVALSNPSSAQGINNNAPKFGTLVPNRIFVGGISSSTTEAELCHLFSKYGSVKATKIIADRAGVSKGYGFVTFDTEEEVKSLIQDAHNIILKERRLNIAPAIKKQPSSRPFDTSSPPPTAPNLYFHNGVPYTFHNGMAFFTPTAHQPTLAPLPPSADPSMYQTYGPAQNAAPAPYGTPVLVPAPPPMYMPQNYSYQPMPMTNGAAPQFIYAGSASSNSSSSSPMAATPDTPHPHLPPPLPPPQFYAHQYPTQEAYFHPPVYISYYNSGDFEAQEQQTTNDECSSTVSTPHSDMSERSSNRSPASVSVHSQFVMMKSKIELSGARPPVASNKGQTGTPVQSSTDSQVPVVSWQNLKNHGEERELYIRDGRRAFHPMIPPPPPLPPQSMVYPQSPFPNSYSTPNMVYQQQPKQSQMADNSRSQRPQNFRGRVRPNVSANNMPFIPKFPANFNNNNPLMMNKNFYDKKPGDYSNGRPQRFTNNRGRGTNRGNRQVSPPPSTPKPTNSYVSSPSPQMMQQTQHYERQYAAVDRPVVVANTTTAPRWSSNPPINCHQIKRLVCNKRQNGSAPNTGVCGNGGGVRLTKKSQGTTDVENDLGGGGDAQPLLQLNLTPPSSPSTTGNNPEVTSKMQSLSLGNSS